VHSSSPLKNNFPPIQPKGKLTGGRWFGSFRITVIDLAPMQIIAITTCTNRKKFPVSAELSATNLETGPQATVAHNWRKRVRSGLAAGLAIDVYCGRSFQEATQAARASGADFRIISGGLGLVQGQERIPSYSLSLVSQSQDFIGARITGSFNASHWWREIQRGAEEMPISKLIRGAANGLTVIGMSSSYLPLIAEDLGSLRVEELDRLRLIGMGLEAQCPATLRHCLLPYDDRLDGPDSPIPGTRGDFASRAMRHFLEKVLPESRSRSLEANKVAVARQLSRWRRPKPILRQARSDVEIIALIKRSWQRIEGKSSLGLRYLRDVEKIACEQGRFRLLVQRAAREVAECRLHCS
jgi:hypothetical protein